LYLREPFSGGKETAPQEPEKNNAVLLMAPPDMGGSLFNLIYGFIYRGSIIRRPEQERRNFTAPDMLFPDKILHNTGLST
jgi:hypothetical protein